MKKKNYYPLAAFIAITSTVCLIQEASAQKFKDPERWYRKPQTMHGKSIVIPIGAHIEGRINDTISSKTRQGQRFSVEITAPILTNGTDVIIPSGSRIMGEVVEAIPSSKQRRVKGMAKPIGKLRTQLSTLTTPDGMSYPIVASIMHESVKTGRYSRENRELSNPNMGYVGDQSNFDVVNPGFQKRPSSMTGPKTMGRREFMRDPIWGKEWKGGQYGAPVIRAVRRQGNEIYIYAGSSLSIRLDAPLKLSLAPSKGALSVDLDLVEPSLEEGSNDGSFRRFQPVSRASEEPPPQEVAAPPPVQQAPPEPDDGLPGFLKEKKKAGFDNSFAPQQQMPPQQQFQQPPQQLQQSPQYQQDPQLQQAPQFQQSQQIQQPSQQGQQPTQKPGDEF